jgi:hypothetical protein
MSLLLVALLGGCGFRSAPDPAGAEDPVKDEDFEARRKAFFDGLRSYVSDLEAAGRYDCCVKVPCTHCALMLGACSCGEGLRRGEPVCEECAYLWTQGQGAEPGVDPSSVRSFLEASRGKTCPCD